ncbi:MAG: hypothetical protein JXR40_11325 [Pontiellaceae bacterium]|nr:hypothetical protein [Pontiellaceae bacterium]
MKPKEIENLRKSTSKKYVLMINISVTLVLLLLIYGIYSDWYLINKFISKSGTTLMKLPDYDPLETYSGIRMMTYERFLFGLTRLSSMTYIIIIWWAARRLQRRNKRLLDYIDELENQVSAINPDDTDQKQC